MTGGPAEAAGQTPNVASACRLCASQHKDWVPRTEVERVGAQVEAVLSFVTAAQCYLSHILLVGTVTKGHLDPRGRSIQSPTANGGVSIPYFKKST